MPYFDERCGFSRNPDTITGREIERLPSSWVTYETFELYTAGSNARTTKSAVYIRREKHLFPRPPTEELARELYLDDEITESEFEELIKQVLEREGINWGDPEALA